MASTMLDDASLGRIAIGAVGGVAVTVFVGFTALGWTLDSKAKDISKAAANAAVVEALAPICAERFQRAADAGQKKIELMKVSSADQGTFIEKGGWAKFTSNNSTNNPAIAEACAKIIGAPK